MSNSPVPPAPTATLTPAEVVREAERADDDKTADDAPAPVHPPRERKMLVRDGQGLDPYGHQDEVELGQAPYDTPAADPAALRTPDPSSDRD